MKYALIVVGYKRINGLSRLLNLLNEAEYFGEEPTLIISIDNSGDNTVEQFAQDFQWLHGEKRIKTYFIIFSFYLKKYIPKIIIPNIINVIKNIGRTPFLKLFILFGLFDKYLDVNIISPSLANSLG